MSISSLANLPDLSEQPNFCAHEHWGSLAPFGRSEDGYRVDLEAGATPSGPVGVWDLVLDPYGGGWLSSAGADPNRLAKEHKAADFHTWWRESPEAALNALRGPLTPHLLTGVFQCVRRGIVKLHGVDIAGLDLATLQEADRLVSATYTNTHDWYRKAMDAARFSGLIRPVHPLFYFQRESADTAQAELAFTQTIMRIDPLLKMWSTKCTSRDRLARFVGVEPVDASSWRDFLGRLLDIAAKNGNTGIKQFQAYSRTLDFQHRRDNEVKFRGRLSTEETLVFQDWLVHECCKQAHDRRWPHQVHVGTNNLAKSSPLPLEALARRYTSMNLVMLHCWPFFEESAYVAKMCNNAHMDTCWQAILNPEFYRRALAEWLGYVPLSKIMCSHDATSVEMAVGSSLFVRELMAEGLAQQGPGSGLAPETLRSMAADMLHNNAVRLYGIAASS